MHAPRTIRTQPDAALDCLAASVENSHRALAKQTHRFVALLREFDLQRAFRGRHVDGRPAADSADWLSASCGVAREQAQEQLRVGYTLLSLPAIEAAFEAGDLSYRKVAALTAVAGPGNQAELLDLARVMTDAQVADYCSRLRERAQAEHERARAPYTAPASQSGDTHGGG